MSSSASSQQQQPVPLPGASHPPLPSETRSHQVQAAAYDQAMRGDIDPNDEVVGVDFTRKRYQEMHQGDDPQPG